MTPELYECRVCGTAFIEYDLYVRHEDVCACHPPEERTARPASDVVESAPRFGRTS